MQLLTEIVLVSLVVGFWIAIAALSIWLVILLAFIGSAITAMMTTEPRFELPHARARDRRAR